jgi:hypothetical protein
MPDPVKSLSWLFRLQRPTRPILLIGAGGSFRAGIPTSEEAVRRIARTAYARHEKGLDEERCVLTPSDWIPYLERQEWFISDGSRYAENFPLAVEHLLFPREFRRDFFRKMLRANEETTQGYRSLARMMIRRLCWTVLTTNFDTLIVETLRQQRPRPPQIIEINRTLDDIVQFGSNNHFQVVYVHGAVETYRDKNLIQETMRLDETLVRRLRPMLIECPLIVVGYRGSEASIMNHLLDEGIQDAGGYRNGIYWCLKKGDTPHPNVSSLREKLGSNFQFVDIDGFDELMTSLDVELENEIWYTAADGPIPSTNISSPADGEFDTQPEESLTVEDLDQPLILSTLSDYCQRLHLPPISKDNYLKFLEAQAYLIERNGKLTPTAGCVLLFGLGPQRVFPYARVVYNPRIAVECPDGSAES